MVGVEGGADVDRCGREVREPGGVLLLMEALTVWCAMMAVELSW